jgi:putative glutamine amidotransferase
VRRPVIGITLGDGDAPGLHAMREDYVRSVEQATAVPVVLPPVDPAHAPLVLDRIDGVVLSGGADVDPAFYGEAPHPKLRRVNRRRDEFELALMREALQRDRPILAICRGLQVLNVASGGTLLQDIPSELAVAMSHDGAGRRTIRCHDVALVAGTRLRSLLGQDTVSVNSFHHQAIDRLGAGLRVSARCPGDGVIEGVEIPDCRFAVAVQWHPESFWRERDSFQVLFDAHAEACRA